MHSADYDELAQRFEELCRGLMISMRRLWTKSNERQQSNDSLSKSQIRMSSPRGSLILADHMTIYYDDNIRMASKVVPQYKTTISYFSLAGHEICYID